jgi:hypothetical protein
MLAANHPAYGGNFAEPSEAAVSANSIRVVDNTIIVEHAPALRIRVDRSIRFLGRHDIRIRDVAAGERLIFAEVKNGSAVRLFIAQFEGFNEGVAGTYNYDLSASPEVAGLRWRSNPFAFNMAESIRSSPGAEAHSTAEFLDRHAIGYPADWMMWRSLTVTTPDRRSELILFYVEDLAMTGKTLADVYRDNEETAYWRSITPALRQRAQAAFCVADLDKENWRQIP